MAKLAGRTYDSSDLKELMDNAGGWAKNWDDILWYVTNVADYDADFAKDEIPDLTDDVEGLKKKDAPFTTDYRRMYREITGKSCDGCPPPEGVESHGMHPRQIADKWLQGLDFPASKHDVVKQAEHNDAPQKLLNVLKKIDDRQYKAMGSVLENIGDQTWDHD